MSANPATGLLDPCICRVSVRKVSIQLGFWHLVTGCFLAARNIAWTVVGRKDCLGQEMLEPSLSLQKESLVEDGSDHGGGNP